MFGHAFYKVLSKAEIESTWVRLYFYKSKQQNWSIICDLILMCSPEEDIQSVGTFVPSLPD